MLLAAFQGAAQLPRGLCAAGAGRFLAICFPRQSALSSSHATAPRAQILPHCLAPSTDQTTTHPTGDPGCQHSRAGIPGCKRLSPPARPVAHMGRVRPHAQCQAAEPHARRVLHPWRFCGWLQERPTCEAPPGGHVQTYSASAGSSRGFITSLAVTGFRTSSLLEADVPIGSCVHVCISASMRARG